MCFIQPGISHDNSVYKLNKPCNTPFPILNICWSMSGSNCCFLTCLQVSSTTGKVSVFFKSVPQFVVIYTVKTFIKVSEAELNVFLELPCFLHDPMNVGNMISGSSASLKFSLYTREFSIHILLKPSLKDFELQRS